MEILRYRALAAAVAKRYHCLWLAGADQSSKALVSNALERLNCEVSLVETAAEAMTKFDPDRFELVIIDLHPIDMSGLEVLRKLKIRSPNASIIVLASNSEVSDVVQALRFGASDYLLKPIADAAVIEHALSQIFQARTLIEQNRVYRTQLESRNRELAEHIALLRRDHEAGRLLQQHLLPHTPYHYPIGIKVAYRLLPSLYLSGDFIDYGLFSERFVAFYLLDVSGHGVSSALVAALIKHSIMYSLRERPLFCQLDSIERDLLDILAMINRELLSIRLEKHASMFAGVIDSHTQQLYYAVAGQLPMPALVSAAGAQWLPGRGRPLGLFDTDDWEAHQYPLPVNWRLVVCSDGVLELLSGDLPYREARLLDLIGSSHGELDTLCSALEVDTVKALPDDISILTLCHDCPA